MDVLDPYKIGLTVRVLTVLFAVALAYISFEAWRRKRRGIFFFVSIAFLAYLARDVLKLSQFAFPDSIPGSVVGMIDLLDLLTLVFIFFALLRE